MTMDPSELSALADSIAEVVDSECDSLALHEFIDGKNDLDKRLWRQAAELGWLGIAIPEAYGGLELGVEALAVLHEKLGSRLAPGPFDATLAAARWIDALCDDATKTSALGQIAAGELSVAVPTALMPPKPAQELVNGALKGRSDILLGAADSAMAIVPARDGDAVAWALVPVDGGAATFETRRPWDPTRCLGALEANGAEPLAVVRDPRAAAELARALSLAIICDSVGAAGTIYRQTVEYQQTRTQFGRPLASFQALKHRAADMHVQHELMRMTAAQAVANASGDDADLWPSLAKATVTDGFVYIAADCVQLHGGVGFTWEYDCHLYQKRAKLNQTLVGANATHIDAAFDAMVEQMKRGESPLEIAL